MTEPSLAALHTRLDRLEREVSWWRRAGVAALACAGLAGAVAATVTTNPDEVKTRRLVITDGEGRDRAIFTVDESDRTRLGGERFQDLDEKMSRRAHLQTHGESLYR